MAADFGTDGKRDVAGVFHVLLVLGYIQIGFVQRERLDEVGMQPENLVDLLRDLAIKRELRRDKNGVGAKPFRRRHRHCRAQAVFAGFVGRGANHRARAIPSHHNGLAAQMGLFAQFYRCVECVHVYMDDFAWGHGDD